MKTKTTDQRRKINPVEKRRQVVKLATTAEEHAEIQAAADRDGLPLATWMRVIALRAARPQPPPRPYVVD